MEDPRLPGVGTRFSTGSFRGTIRYVGEVENTEGVWLGVEWDDASRGKHSGSRGDTCYFTCRVANSGSFIRLSSKISFGSSFLQALKAKYSADSNSFVAETKAKQYGRRNLADIEVETPNMADVIKRSAQLHKLREIGLGGWKREATLEGTDFELESYTDVARAFDDRIGEKGGDIRKTCPNVRGIDLSRSLLPSWLEVSRIAIELPLLESLLLHFNRFDDLSPETLPLSNAFHRLRDLRVDGTLVSWKDVLFLADVFPCLESLQMGSNKISKLGERQKNRLCKLKVLNLEGNSLSDWNDVWSSMEACPSLERLILSSNEFSSISTTDRKDQRTQIRHISIWNNPISSWADVDALDACVGGLKSLVLGGGQCKLTKDKSMQDIRLIAIARLSKLQSFNNAPVLAIERREAELYYISVVEKEALSEEERGQLHPRSSYLCQIHGISQRVALNGSNQEAIDIHSDGTLRNKLLSVKIYISSQPPTSQPPHIFPAPESYTTTQVELNLLTTTPLRLLKGKLARSFSLKKGHQSIQSIWALLSPTLDPLQTTAQLLRNEMRPQESTSVSNERITFEMDSLERNLHGYNFSHGDEIVLVVSQI